MSIGADGRHGDGGDDGDDVGEEDDPQPLQYAGVAHYPGESEEEHHPPYVEQARDIDPCTPSKLVHFTLLSISPLLQN